MATFNQLRAAIIERIGEPLPDLTGYTYLPDLVECPAFYIEPDRPFITYEETYGSFMATYNMLITLLVDRIDEESAQEELDPFLEASGPFIGALLDTRYRDSLYQLTNGYVHVVAADNYGNIWDRQRQTQYYGAQIHISLHA